MPVFKPEMPKPNCVDDFTTPAANAAQLVDETDAALDEEIPVDEEIPSVEQEPPVVAGPAEDTEDAADGNRGRLRTREAYLKKGEDLIRSLL